MDINPSNLIITQDFELKIRDFSKTFWQDKDQYVLSTGSINYRAPEVILDACNNPFEADIYSLGVTLFILMFGKFPYFERKFVEGVNLFQLMLQEDMLDFWKIHQSFNTFDVVDEDFANLFEMMISYNPHDRATLEEISESAWMQKVTYTDGELLAIMEKKKETFQDFEPNAE